MEGVMNHWHTTGKMKDREKLEEEKSSDRTKSENSHEQA